MSQPIPLICIGRHREIALAIEKQIGSNFTYSAIMTSYNNDTLTALLETLNPPPRGIIIGGDFSLEEVRAVEQFRDESKGLKVVAVPQGTFEREGRAGLVSWVKDALGTEYGVSWGEAS
jgi:hypothetical protein